MTNLGAAGASQRSYESLGVIMGRQQPDGCPYPLPLFFVSVDSKRLRFLVSPLESTLAALA
jgi:hypothetical protein